MGSKALFLNSDPSSACFSKNPPFLQKWRKLRACSNKLFDSLVHRRTFNRKEGKGIVTTKFILAEKTDEDNKTEIRLKTNEMKERDLYCLKIILTKMFFSSPWKVFRKDI